MPSETVESFSSVGSFGRRTRRCPPAPLLVTMSAFHLAYAFSTSPLRYAPGYVHRGLMRFCGNGNRVPFLGGAGPRAAAASAGFDCGGVPPPASGRATDDRPAFESTTPVVDSNVAPPAPAPAITAGAAPP